MRDIIEPRLQLLAGCLADTACLPCAEENRGTVVFNQGRRYSASVTLDMGLSLGASGEAVALTYHLRIIPVLFQYPAEDALTFGLDCLDEQRIADFVEEKILQSVEAYLRVQAEPHYQQDSMVVDPVCGMTIHRLDAAAPVVHQDSTYYFCVPACKEKFVRDPSRYL